MSKPGPVPTSKPVPVSHACAEDGNPFGGGSRIFNRRAGRVWSLVWLAWLAYPLSALFESHASTLHVALTVLGATVAVGAYVSLFGCESLFDPPTARDWAALVVLGALGVALTAFDRPDWLTLLYFVASGGAMRLPGRRYLPVLAAALATVALGSWLAGSGTSNLLSSVGIVFALGAALAGFRQVLGTNVALIAARNEVARLAVAEERLRFARDLHDLLGHSLSVIALKAELAGRLIERSPDRAAGEVTDICSVARSALAEVREAVGGYRQVGLAGEVVSARSALAAAGIELEVSGVSEAAALSPEVSETAAWVLREGTTNVIRHSGGHRCWVNLSVGADEVRMTVADDGAGALRDREAGGLRDREEGGPRANSCSFPPKMWTTATAAVAGGAGGHGLQGLSERVGALGGRMQAGAGPQGGFVLEVRIPTTPLEEAVRAVTPSEANRAGPLVGAPTDARPAGQPARNPDEAPSVQAS